MLIRPAAAHDWPSVLEINAEGRPGVAELDARELTWFAHYAAHFLVAASGTRISGYLLALAPEAAYPGEEFAWFQARYADFLYVDQVAVASAMRGGGVGKALYAELMNLARHESRGRLLCEVNLEPANPDSLRFHARLGFREQNTLALADGRVVSLQERKL
ncbi:GNAT family N-acetyltransferase [Halomonas heilongjiangensis]|uniref:GNAT family N-acetyltransferase n=1 Tax=Halomonas heilongjiangensis TaxID=1387883 RepID=A0A2N7TG32_9GAMM|nr:GNAT family N-acetyltransferase [Halomonas heilongjiangensis]PMR67125.1 GNAT family N-acetyltransferase [Halomonas heilongjiangensis]PXX87864.1 GNAT family N-acetyltransferase [Halomonas heilongjiangensis]